MDANGWTPLMRAVYKGDLQVQKKKRTALLYTHSPILCSHHVEQVSLELIKAGANLEAQISSGHTALMLAAQKGHEQCLLELLKAGAAFV